MAVITPQPAGSELVLVKKEGPHTVVLTLNRPSKRNALSQEVINTLLARLGEASEDNEVHSIIITGSGSFFSAGADIKEISQLDSAGARRRRYLEDLCNGVRSVRKPVIAAVEGKALGGGFELALLCDFIVGTTSSEFGFPEVTIGLLPGAGGTQRLTNIVGKYRAMNTILLNTPIDGTEAHQLGLVANLTEPGKALERALEISSKLAQFSISAVAMSKEAICRADELGRDEEFERSLYYAAFSADDKKEGVAAFLEKRSPIWKNHA